MRQEPVLRAVRRSAGDDEAVALRLGDGSPPEGVDAGEWREYLRRRRDLGMGEHPHDLAFTDAQGAPLDAGGLDRYLRLARSVRISLQSNTEFCTGLLAARYDGEHGVEGWQRKEAGGMKAAAAIRRRARRIRTSVATQPASAPSTSADHSDTWPPAVATSHMRASSSGPARSARSS